MTLKSSLVLVCLLGLGACSKKTDIDFNNLGEEVTPTVGGFSPLRKSEIEVADTKWICSPAGAGQMSKCEVWTGGEGQLPGPVFNPDLEIDMKKPV